MNRRSLFGWLLALPAAIAGKAKADKGVPFMPGMRLRLVGAPPSAGPFAAHSHCITEVLDAETGHRVTNIHELDIRLRASAWMVAAVTVTAQPLRIGPDRKIARERHLAEIEVLDITTLSDSPAVRIRNLEDELARIGEELREVRARLRDAEAREARRSLAPNEELRRCV